MYKGLQKVCLSISHGVTIRLVNKLGEGHDDEIIERKKSLITSLVEVTIHNCL